MQPTQHRFREHNQALGYPMSSLLDQEQRRFRWRVRHSSCPFADRQPQSIRYRGYLAAGRFARTEGDAFTQRKTRSRTELLIATAHGARLSRLKKRRPRSGASCVAAGGLGQVFYTSLVVPVRGPTALSSPPRPVTERTSGRLAFFISAKNRPAEGSARSRSWAELCR